MQPADSSPSIPLSVASATADPDDIYDTVTSDIGVLQTTVPSVDTPATKEEVEQGLFDALNHIYQTRGDPRSAGGPTSAAGRPGLRVQCPSVPAAIPAVTSCPPEIVFLHPQQQQQQQQRGGGAVPLRRTASDSAVQLPLSVVCSGSAAWLNRQCDQQQFANVTLLRPLLLPTAVQSASPLVPTIPSLVPAPAAVRHAFILPSPPYSSPSIPVSASVVVAAAAAVSVRDPRPPRSAPGKVTVVAARPKTSVSSVATRFQCGLNAGKSSPGASSASRGVLAPRPGRPSSSSPAAAVVMGNPSTSTTAVPATAAAAAAAAAAAVPAVAVPEKQLRNRAAAAKCRDKRLQQQRKMAERVAQLTTENAGLSEHERGLQQRVDRLERLLQRHRSDTGACCLQASGKIGVEF